MGDIVIEYRRRDNGSIRARAASGAPNFRVLIDKRLKSSIKSVLVELKISGVVAGIPIKHFFVDTDGQRYGLLPPDADRVTG